MGDASEIPSLLQGTPQNQELRPDPVNGQMWRWGWGLSLEELGDG